MSKIRLVYKEGNHPCFQNGFIERIVRTWYDIELYDSQRTYNPQDTVLLITHVEDVEERRNPGQKYWYTDLEQSGFKVVVDHLWDSDVDTPTVVKNGRLILRNRNWVWYNECIRFVHQEYHNYQPRKNYTHAFLMPMHKTRWHRDQALERLAPVLHRALWSYVERGHLLPGDADHSDTSQLIFWEFFSNFDWYDRTFFSVVAESYMRSDSWISSPVVPNYRTEVSEKVFKPFIFYHPLIVYGSLGTLEYLQREGFETFANLWDESYDQITVDQQRHVAVSNLILDVVDRFDRGELGIDSETQQKLQHNHARFFDRDLVLKRFESEIISDLQRFIG